jgi:hypothetical protein
LSRQFSAEWFGHITDGHAHRERGEQDVDPAIAAADAPAMKESVAPAQPQPRLATTRVCEAHNNAPRRCEIRIREHL